MYFADPSAKIDPPIDGVNLGPFVGAAFAIVIAILCVILFGCAILRFKAKKTGLTVSANSTQPVAIPMVAIPMVGGLTALLVYSH